MADAPPPGSAVAELPQDLVGKAAIVTGGSRGIGRTICIHLARRGAAVAVVYQGGKDEAEKTLAEMPGSRNVVVQADLSKPEDVARLFEEVQAGLGRLDILVNNAGVMDSKYAKIKDIPDETIFTTVNVNLIGAFLCLREAARRMEDGGRIVNITTSLVAFTNPGYGVAIYAGTKAALETITKCMAPELKGRRITVNAVAPGPVATELFFRGKTDEQIERLKNMNQMQRLGQPDDIAAVVGFLCSPSGEWVNAQIIRANGGSI